MALVISASRDVVQTMMLATMLLCGWTAASDGCPSGCYCDENREDVSCFDIGSFPTGLPTTMKKVTIMRSNLIEIPSGAFDNCPNLTSLTFIDVTIGTIRRRAFYRIGRGIPDKALMISKVTIENIESGAFEELEDFNSISISDAKMSNISSGAFSKFSNITTVSIVSVNIPIMHSSTFKDFSNITAFTVASSAFDIIEQETMTNFIQVGNFIFFDCVIGSAGSHFLTLQYADNVNIFRNHFGLWEKCAFCGVSATKVNIFNNVVNGSEGNVFSGMSGVKSLNIFKNTIPLIVARFFPFDLVDFGFFGNKVKTILCEQSGTDYPQSIKYSIVRNDVTCDCRLNWMWMTWSQTLAAQVLTPGFVCAGPDEDRQSLSDFFNKVSTSVITPPCNGLEAVNDCSASTTNAGLETSTNVGRETSTDVGRETSTDIGRETSTDVGRETSTNVGRETSTDVGRETSTDVGRETSTDVGRETSTDAKASAVTSKAGWISVLAVVLTVMASQKTFKPDDTNNTLNGKRRFH